ncbi:MAG: SlyX family protein [Sneathiella sp.]
MTDLTEKRLTDLELKITEQDQVINDLSDMVGAQWQEIEKLIARLTTAQERIVTLEESLPASNQAEKPPHY